MKRIKRRTPLFIVYMHILPNGKRYIGITRNTIKRRSQNGYNYRTQPYYHAILKYGWDNIEKKEIIWGVTEDVAKAWEQALIAMWKTQDREYGYNFTSGGDFTYEENKKPVICIETLTIYESIEEAKRRNNMDGSHISDCCNGKRLTVNGYHWQHYDETKSLEYYKNLKFRKRKFKDKAVICLETLEVYKSATDASNQLKIKGRVHISSCCSGKRNIAGGYHWAYYDELKSMDYYKKLLAQKLENEKCKIDKPVILIETKKIYINAREAAKENNILRPDHIVNNCEGRLKSVGGFHWAYYDPNKKIKQYDNLIIKNLRKRPVLLVETGEIFESLAEASLFTGVCRTGISHCLSGRSKKSGGYHWKYAEEGKA